MTPGSGYVPPTATGTAAASPPAAAEAPPVPAPAPLSAAGEAIAKGYTFDEPSIQLGVLVEDDTPKPAASIRIPLSMLNRHGLVAGATGTGKTKTLQLMTEQISAA